MKKLLLWGVAVALVCVGSGCCGCHDCYSVPATGERWPTSSDEVVVGYDNDVALADMKYSQITMSEYTLSEYWYLAVPRAIQGAFSYAPMLRDVNKEIQNLYVRNNYGFVYAIARVRGETDGESAYLFMLFESPGYYFVDGMLFGKLHDRQDFSTLEVATSTLEQVRQIDPQTIHISIGSEKSQSYHRCDDGTLVEISYKSTGDTFIVQEVEMYDDPAEFVHKILPIDRRALS